MNLHLSYVKYRLNRTGEWREELLSKYTDPRIRLAATTLRQLADADDAEVSPENASALAAYTGPSLVFVVDEAAREVAFRCFPADINDFIEIVLDKDFPPPVAPSPVVELGR